MSRIKIDRRWAASLGQEAVAVVAAGGYRTADGAWIDLRDAITDAALGTVSYGPGVRVPAPATPPRPTPTTLTVVDDTTLAVARRLVTAGRDVAALNFASARNPGGGFLAGARAQEESLARSSALVTCIEGQAMYDHHRNGRDALYRTWVIYSPAVPVFRGDDSALLARPWPLAFLTSPAVNAKVVLERDPGRSGAVRDAMAERIDHVLAVAAAHGHDALVLGAWGCGVFGNDPTEIAGLFASALAGRWRDRFAEVVFAIVDESVERRFIGPFEARFAAGP